MKKSIISAILAIITVLSLTSCGASSQEKLKVGLLKGPTGVGASYMMENCSEKYEFTVEADASIITNSFISGALDVAAVPTNVASILYNKMNGEVKIAAVNTLSVLYILENGNTVSSVSDLKGKTLYTTGQGANPEYVLNYILRENGLEPGTDVTVEFMDSTELVTRAAGGLVDLCMLPMPSASSVLMGNSDYRIALSVGDEWEKLSGGEPLPQGCIVMRKDVSISDFLKDYAESILYMSDEANLDSAASLAVKYDIIPKEALAKASIPYCGLTFVSGTEMSAILAPYFEVMLNADPISVGGKIPSEDIYYEGN